MKSYNDPAKQQARMKLKDFIEKHLLTHKKPQELRVLCFPGAEQDGEEALEVKEIYDTLGIPRKNITGLEMDPTRAQRLHDSDLGIDIVQENDLEFLLELKDRTQWDIVCLDYTSYLHAEHSLVFAYLVKDQRLAARNVICTNFLGQRENRGAQDFHNWLEYIRNKSDAFRDAVNMRNTPRHHPKTLEEHRQQNIRARVIDSLVNGTASTPFYEEILPPAELEKLEEQFKQAHAELRANAIPRHRKILDTIRQHRSLDDIRYLLSHQAYELLTEGVRYIAQEIFDIDALAWIANFAARNRSYLVEDSQSYEYRSESGSRMLFDLYYCMQHRQKLNKLRGLLEITYETPTLEGLRIAYGKQAGKRLIRTKEQLRELYDAFTRSNHHSHIKRARLS